MNNLLEQETIKIEDMIYEIRGKQVMLDSDLAKLYQCKNGTKTINQAVMRNIIRFPEDFYFQLTNEEFRNLKSQFGTSKGRHGGVRKLPYVFTEQGVAMLSSVLRTEIASKVSINIMRAFVLMRKYLSSSNYQRRIENLETKAIEHDRKFEEIFDRLDPKINNHIFFEGQIYDAYSLLIDIFSLAREQIILIDNYVNKKFFDVISHIQIKVILITSNKSHLTDVDIEKYHEEYFNLEIKYSSSFHDRFILIDNSILYHCGASFKDLGKKCFAINKIEDDNILQNLLNELGED